MFSGIGGFRLGLERTGHECVWSNEWDSYSRAVYTKHFGECDGRDVRSISVQSVPDFELLCGGFPCQDFSIAGRRTAFEGDRGALWFEVYRFITGKRPKYIFLENVPGLFSVREGRTFAYIIWQIAKAGYGVQWLCLNSKDFGVPQNRERLFIIGHLGGVARPQVFHFGQEDGDDSKRQEEQARPQDNQEVTTALDANYWKGPDMHGQRTLIQIGNIDQKGHNSMWGRVYDPNGLAPNLTDGGGLGAKTGLIATKKVLLAHTKGNIKQREQDLDHSWCLDTTGMKMAIKSEDAGLRKLTPKECERLQGFPDNWTEFGVDDKGTTIDISDTQRYKQLGNAVTVNVIEWFGKVFKEMERSNDEAI